MKPLSPAYFVERLEAVLVDLGFGEKGNIRTSEATKIIQTQTPPPEWPKWPKWRLPKLLSRRTKITLNDVVQISVALKVDVRLLIWHPDEVPVFQRRSPMANRQPPKP